MRTDPRGERRQPPVVFLGVLVAATLVGLAATRLHPALYAEPLLVQEPPPPPPCPDADGDGYVVVSGGCAIPEGRRPGDCNDSNSAISPGAAEFCGDGIDNNCDGDVDFGAGQPCTLTGPTGCTPGEAGCCLTPSIRVCAPDGASAFCAIPEAGIDLPEPEGPSPSPTCYDEADNDCDDLTDAEEPSCVAIERCNGVDDDFDGLVDEDFSLGGLPVGSDCSAGIGACSRTGTVTCAADGSGAVCTATPGEPRDESPLSTGRCSDNVDNDCDGLTDSQDPSCTEVERCDGLDNDFDGEVDEGFVLGEACQVGVGACAASGVTVCASSRVATTCSVVPERPGIEGPSGATCGDGIDNDCDGFTDAQDSNCASASIVATCALPYLRGNPGSDCTGWHRIEFTTSGHASNATVTAELLALAEDGTVLQTIPVQAGDSAHLASRINPADFKVSSRGGRHEVFAPIPLLRVTVDDGLNKAQAFCSNIPYLQVMEPNGNVVTETEGDVTRVLAAIPLVDPSTLFVKVDGVNVFEKLNIPNPAVCTLASPCGGTVMIKDKPVTVSDLVVQSAPSVDVPAGNTLRMTLTDLGCGGHVVVVDGERAAGSFPEPSSAECFVDDTRDRGLSAGFAVDISSPAVGEVTEAVPTPVEGQACHGRQIAAANVNGKPVDVTGQVFTPGDGEDSGDLYVLPIHTTLDQTNIARDVAAGDTPLGTFDAGSNRVILGATDDLGNRTFESRIFAVGQVAAPGGAPPAASSSAAATPQQDAFGKEELNAQIQEELNRMIVEQLQTSLAATSVEIEHAFSVGLNPDAIQQLFTARCTPAGFRFANIVRARILAVPVRFTRVNGGCSCDPTVAIRIASVQIDPTQVSCPVTFDNDEFRVSLHLPDVRVTATANGSCKRKALGVCVAKTSVNITSTTDISNIQLNFKVTEGQLLGATPNPPIFIRGTSAVQTSGGVSVGCLASVCNWAIEGLVSILSFGTVTLDLTPSLDISNVVDFNAEIGAAEPDPIALSEIKVDEQQVAEFDQTLSGRLSSVEITPHGLVASLRGTFATNVVDPEVPGTPGALLTPAPPPTLPVPNAEDAFIVLADDTFNQLYASLTAAGRLKTQCLATGKTLGDFLPVSCESIDLATPGATALARGACHAIRGHACETLVGPTVLLTAVEQGACHGARGDNCSAIPLDPVLGDAERSACQATPDLNLAASQPVVLCARDDIPPRLLVHDQAGTADIESSLRLNDLSVALVVDRDANGQLDSALTSTPRCFAQGSPTIGDCNLYAVCLDLNFKFDLQGQVCPDGKPGLVNRFRGVQVLNRQAGVVCGAGLAGDDERLISQTSTDEGISMDLGMSVDRFAPPICGAGLDLGGFVSCAFPRLVAIETDGNLEFQDFLGITCDIFRP